MATYDKSVIHDFADRLYAKAQSVVLVYVIVGIVSGAAVCLYNTMAGLLLAAIFGFIGFLIGNEKAFSYRLQAQIALCQVKIEENLSRRQLPVPEEVEIPLACPAKVTQPKRNKMCPKCHLRHPDHMQVCPECSLELVSVIWN